MLGNTSQETAHGYQIVGRRLQILSGRAVRRKASAGGFAEWIVDGGAREFACLTADPGRTAGRVGQRANRGAFIVFVLRTQNRVVNRDIAGIKLAQFQEIVRPANLIGTAEEDDIGAGVRGGLPVLWLTTNAGPTPDVKAGP